MTTQLDLLEQRYPDVAGYRRTETSRQAALSVDAETMRGYVLAAYAHHPPMTPDECAALLRQSILTVRPRCSELRRLGKLTTTGLRRPNASGRLAEVLTAVV